MTTEKNRGYKFALADVMNTTPSKRKLNTYTLDFQGAYNDTYDGFWLGYQNKDNPAGVTASNFAGKSALFRLAYAKGLQFNGGTEIDAQKAGITDAQSNNNRNSNLKNYSSGYQQAYLDAYQGYLDGVYGSLTASSQRNGSSDAYNSGYVSGYDAGTNRDENVHTGFNDANSDAQKVVPTKSDKSQAEETNSDYKKTYLDAYQGFLDGKSDGFNPQGTQKN